MKNEKFFRMKNLTIQNAVPNADLNPASIYCQIHSIKTVSLKDYIINWMNLEGKKSDAKREWYIRQRKSLFLVLCSSKTRKDSCAFFSCEKKKKE